jgi:hypothetical protein
MNLTGGGTMLGVALPFSVSFCFGYGRNPTRHYIEV